MSDIARTSTEDFDLFALGGFVDPVKASATSIPQVIAEYQAAAEAHDKAMSAADRALYAAFPDPMTRPDEDEKRPDEEEEELPPHIQRLYDEAERLYRVMDAAYSRVIAAPCASLGDCIAVLEWGGDGDVETVIDMVLPCLRRLAGAA